MDRDFDLRQSVYGLPPDQIRMIAIAREHGAHAKFTGSGGAAIGTYVDAAHLRLLKGAYEDEGFTVVPSAWPRRTGRPGRRPVPEPSSTKPWRANPAHRSRPGGGRRVDNAALNAILLAAGYGTRVRALFPDTPKALIEIGGRPVLSHLLDKPGARRRRHCCHHRYHDRHYAALQSYLSSRPSRLPTRLLSDSTCAAEQRLGALGDLQFALDRIGCQEDLLVAATDKLLAFELGDALQFARLRAAPVNVCVQAPNRAHLAGRHGCVVLDRTGRIVDFEEKPRHPKSRLASLAIYVLPWRCSLCRRVPAAGRRSGRAGHFVGWLARAHRRIRLRRRRPQL